MEMRSSAVKSLARDLDLLMPTATTTSSKSPEAREMMSMCPLVTGSKEPGQTALRTRLLLPFRAQTARTYQSTVSPYSFDRERSRPGGHAGSPLRADRSTTTSEPGATQP